MPPALAHGKVAYIEIPALDIQRSADFYAHVFGWKLGKRADGSTSFDDPTGEVRGTWVVGRSATSAPGLLIYIMVDNIAEALDAVIRYGGEALQPIDSDTLELIGRFRDPGGNVIGLYQSVPVTQTERDPRSQRPRYRVMVRVLRLIRTGL